jgi:arylsulfatase
MAVRYPRLITDGGGLRSQFTHCIDIGPTILELAGIPQPTQVEGIAQTPVYGTSFLHTFADAAAEERTPSSTFEIYGYRAMYKDGCWLAQQIERIPWDLTPATVRKFAPGVWQPDNDRAELYYLPDDFTQAHDLADQYPDKVTELRELFWAEAENTRSCRCWPG